MYISHSVYPNREILMLGLFAARLLSFAIATLSSGDRPVLRTTTLGCDLENALANTSSELRRFVMLYFFPLFSSLLRSPKVKIPLLLVVSLQSMNTA